MFAFGSANAPPISTRPAKLDIPNRHTCFMISRPPQNLGRAQGGGHARCQSGVRKEEISELQQNEDVTRFGEDTCHRTWEYQNRKSLHGWWTKRIPCQREAETGTQRIRIIRAK